MNTEEERPVPVGAVMAKLRDNTSQRNDLYWELKGANRKTQTIQEKHIETLGRLLKYEGSSIIEEIYDFAWANSMAVYCNSAVFDIKTTIGEYKNKKGKISMAHYTIYGHYLGSVDQMGLEPVYYDGNFNIRKYQLVLKERINYAAKNVSKIEDIFDLEIN